MKPIENRSSKWWVFERSYGVYRLNANKYICTAANGSSISNVLKKSI